jgi:hypothetical protein
MLTSLHISGFRTFREFSVGGLTRVNLLVGRNNVGKTAVMEAAEILLAGGEPWVLLRSPTRRGDGFVEPPSGRLANRVVDVLPLFHGYGGEGPHRFHIEGVNGERCFVRCEIVARPEQGDNQAVLPGIDENAQLSMEDVSPAKALMIAGDRFPAVLLPLSSGHFLPINAPGRFLREDEPRASVNFVDTKDPQYRLGALWDRVVLTPQEERVIQALRVIEPSIERIASLGNTGRSGSAPFMVVRLAGADDRVPIGTMGDGVQRLLTLSVNLVGAAGGKLFVDEIDTGLHHTTLAKMWRLVIETARDLDVQVLATTHSIDCLRALAEAHEAAPSIGSEISVHRIVRGASESVRFGPEELQTAIRQDMEIR